MVNGIGNACGLRNRGKGKNAAQNARLKAKAKEVKVVKKPVVEKKEREKEEDEEVEEREPRSLRKRKRGEEREEVAETKEGIKEPADEEPVDEGSETAQQNSSEDASEGHSKEEGKAANEEPAKEEHELDTHDAPMPQAEPSPAELEPIPTRTSRRPSLSNEAPVTSDKTKSIRPPVTSPDRPSRGKCFHCGTSDTPCFRRMKGEGDEMLCGLTTPCLERAIEGMLTML